MQLAAYADGTLPEAEAAAMAAHLATHPGDRAWVAAVIASNAQVQAAFAAPMHEPVPAAMLEAIWAKPQADNVVPFRPRRLVPWAGAAMAASVAAALLLGAWDRGPAPLLAPGGPITDAPLIAALERAASGQSVALNDGTLVPSLSFFAADGRPCREVALQAATAQTHAVVCKSDTDWTVEVAVAQPAQTRAGGTDFTPASGSGEDPLAAVLDRLGASPGLDPAAEAALIAQGWPARP